MQLQNILTSILLSLSNFHRWLFGSSFSVIGGRRSRSGSVGWSITLWSTASWFTASWFPAYPYAGISELNPCVALAILCITFRKCWSCLEILTMNQEVHCKIQTLEVYLRSVQKTASTWASISILVLPVTVTKQSPIPWSYDVNSLLHPSSRCHLSGDEMIQQLVQTPSLPEGLGTEPPSDGTMWWIEHHNHPDMIDYISKYMKPGLSCSNVGNKTQHLFINC